MREVFKNRLKIKSHTMMTKTKNTRPTKRYNFISTFLLPLDLQQHELCPRFRGRVGHSNERVAASVFCEGEAKHGNLDKILKEAPQVYLTREIPQSQGTVPLTQVGCPQSAGG